MIFPRGVYGALAYRDNVFTEKMCSSIIEYAENNKELMYQGPTMGGLDTSIKNCYDFGISSNAKGATELQKIDLDIMNKQIFNQITGVIQDYCKYYPALNIDWVNRYDTGYQFQKYLANEGFYKEHCDGGPFYEDGSQNRVLALIVYLNTVQMGGGTRFPLHDYTVDAVCGRVSIFPSNFTHPHAGLMPLESPKYIISTFCYTSPSIKNNQVNHEKELSEHYKNA